MDNNLLPSPSSSVGLPHSSTVIALTSASAGQTRQVQTPRVEVALSGDAADPLTEEALEAAAPENVRILIKSVISRYALSREQYVAIYDEFERQNSPEGGGNARALSMEAVVAPVVSEGVLTDDGQEDQQLTGEANRLQSVVQSAMETYELSPVVTKNVCARKTLTLPDDPVPSAFARELLQRDQALVAQAVRKYLHQYSIPQREVVEKTGINQSHLSQHFTRGVPIKPAKRIKLYHWFEQDQMQRTGKLSTADGSLTAVLESPKVEGYRRRPRWRWSPVATQILSEAFKKNRFPTREQRQELSRICNEAEAAMNNGEPLQGPEGDTEGITEQRINTWFTNRRKGLITPSPTTEGPSLTAAPAASLAILSSPSAITPGLTLATPTSDVTRTANFQASKLTATTPTLTLPLSLPSSTSTNQITSEPITLTTAPLAISPIQLQSILSQLQGQPNAVTPILAQNLGQILVGQIPPGGITLQSPQTAAISMDTVAKHLQIQQVTSGISVSQPTVAEATESPSVPMQEGLTSDHVVAGEEEIFSNSVQPSAVNSKQS